MFLFTAGHNCVTCAELENHLGIADKTLAEFVIELASGRKTSKEYALVRIADPIVLHNNNRSSSVWNRTA
jgi:hypothetical protein